LTRRQRIVRIDDLYEGLLRPALGVLETSGGEAEALEDPVESVPWILHRVLRDERTDELRQV